MFQGETLDSIANGISWVVLVIAPIIGITVFWLLHVMPEKIAEKKHHPQAHAIQCLCLLSLVFGGILWPLAWIWAYTKPMCDRLKKELPPLGYKLITPVDAPCSIVVVQARDLKVTEQKLRKADVQVTTTGFNRVRISPAFYNNMEDINRLLATLA